MTKQTILDLLVKVRALIDKPENWTQNNFAKDKLGGNLVSLYSKEAACFCLQGAIYRVAATKAKAKEAIMAFTNLVPFGFISDFNDTHTHAEVITLLDLAIAAERTKMESV